MELYNGQCAAFSRDAWCRLSSCVSGYVPESFFLEGKDRPGCRVLHDDCAVVEASEGLRILASRGFGADAGASLASLLHLTAAQCARLSQFSESKEHCCLMDVGDASVFFFSAWYAPCRLLLAVRVHAEAREVRRVLAAAEERAGVPLFDTEKDHATPTLLLQLAEIFYYTDHILTPTQSLWTHCRTVANFVGCRVEDLHLPLRTEALSADDFHRLTAFLCCLFLTLRARTGHIHAAQMPTDAGEDEGCFTLRVEQRVHRSAADVCPFEGISLTEKSFAFLELPAFRAFSGAQIGRDLVFDLAFSKPQAATVLSATPWQAPFVSLIIHVVDLFLPSELPMSDVYVAAIPQEMPMDSLYPAERLQEVLACRNERLRCEKYCAWKLLEHAVKHSTELDFEDLSFTQTPNGKWLCDRFYFSITHSNGVVAVVLSDRPIGVDIEAVDAANTDALQKCILTEHEREIFFSLPEHQRACYLIEKWTGKESIFKCTGERAAPPDRIEATDTQSIRLCRNGRSYILSIAGERADQARLVEVELSE